MIKKKFTPFASLKKEINWNVQEIPFMPEKSKNSSLKFGLIGTERLYRGLSYEGDMFFLSEDNWKITLKYEKLDFILVESCFESVTGEWSLALTDPNFANNDLYQLIVSAKRYNIPTIYWLTVDYQYHELFSKIVYYFDYIFCADPRETEILKNLGIQAETLLPAVQPAIYNGITEYPGKDVNRIPGICDGLADVIKNWDKFGDFYKELLDFNINFFDSFNQIWESKLNSLINNYENILGKISFFSRVFLFKKANIYCDFSNRETSRTERQWQVLEAAASRLPIIILGNLDQEDILNRFSWNENNERSFFIELIRHQKDELYRERIAQKTWREVVSQYTFANRMKTIAEKLDVCHSWKQSPSAALVTPSKRPEFFDRAKENFINMKYPNKEWVFVFNGPYKEFPTLKKKVESIKNAKAVYVPVELHAGACLNVGFQYATSDYVYRMDDDDFYGSNYLTDNQLYLRVMDYVNTGKIFKYFYIKEEYSNYVYSRNVKMFNFYRPSAIQISQFPNNFSILCGASQGGFKEFMLENKYSFSCYGSVDLDWLFFLKENSCNKRALVTDDLNLVVERRMDNSHTWNADINKMSNNSIAYISKINEVSET